jgi:hypothetical protein
MAPVMKVIIRVVVVIVVVFGCCRVFVGDIPLPGCTVKRILPTHALLRTRLTVAV